MVYPQIFLHYTMIYIS